MIVWKQKIKFFSDKSEIENNEIKIDSGKYDNTSNINNIKRINILENEGDKNNDKMFNSKIFNDGKNSNLNDINLQPLSIRIAKRNKKLSEIKSDLDVRNNKIINYPEPKKKKKIIFR